jgi:transposase
MRRYSEAVKADVRKRMSPPHRQSVAQISAELGIHVVTIYNWRKVWRLQGEAVPASGEEPKGWSAADKFTVVMETASLNATELSAYCRERGLFPEQVERWRQAARDANEQPVLTLKEQKELEKLRAQDQREIKARVPAGPIQSLVTGSALVVVAPLPRAPRCRASPPAGPRGWS